MLRSSASVDARFVPLTVILLYFGESPRITTLFPSPPSLLIETPGTLATASAALASGNSWILSDEIISVDNVRDRLSQRLNIKFTSGNIEPEDVASLIRGPDARGSERTLLSWTDGKEDLVTEDKTLGHLVHGPVDCDQMDYLLRDSHFTGVTHGIVDHHRLISCLRRHGGDIAVEEGGLASLEGMLLARGLMYSAVYFHRVTRVTEVMLSRAVERSEDFLPNPEDMQRSVDAEIWQALYEAGDYSRDMMRRLKYRQMLKVATSRRQGDLSESQIERLIEIANSSKKRREIEDDLAHRAGLKPGYVAIDVPSVKLLLSEPRMDAVDIRIIGDDGKTRKMSEHTPIADALKKRQVSQAVVYVMTLSGYEKSVAELAERNLFG